MDNGVWILRKKLVKRYYGAREAKNARIRIRAKANRRGKRGFSGWLIIALCRRLGRYWNLEDNENSMKLTVEALLLYKDAQSIWSIYCWPETVYLTETFNILYCCTQNIRKKTRKIQYTNIKSLNYIGIVKMRIDVVFYGQTDWKLVIQERPRSRAHVIIRFPICLLFSLTN